jgi:hypothetical protein
MPSRHLLPAGLRRRIAAGLVVAVLVATSVTTALLSTPAPADAASASLGATGATVPCGSVNDFVQESSTGDSYRVPAGLWRLTSWRTEQVGSLATSLQLYVLRPTGTPGGYTVVARTPMSTTTNQGLNTFTLAEPVVVSGGDVLGFRPASGTQLCGRVVSGSRYRLRTGAAAAEPGESITFPSALTGAEFNIAATLESLAVRHNAVPATRAVDTRLGIGAAATRLAPGQVLTIPVAGTGGIPGGALGATVNLTTANSDPGFLTAYPCDAARPDTSSINPKPGAAVANIANVLLSRTGTMCIVSAAATDLIVDVVGWWGVSGDLYNALPGRRLLDTRATTPLRAGEVRTVPIAGSAGVPASGAGAVTLNLTTVNSTPGYLTAYPCDEPRPGTSSVNPQAGVAVANLASVKLSAAGSVCIYAEVATDLLIDVAGWWGATGLPYNPTAGSRAFDSRATGRLAAGSVAVLALAGRNGVPTSGAQSVTLNITSVNSDPGYVTAYPCDAPRPDTSSLNPQSTNAVANVSTVTLSVAGSVCLFTETPTDLIVDVLGWWGD